MENPENHPGIDINHQSSDGETMLHVIVRLREPALAVVLLNGGANINIKDNRGNTPFSSAIDTGSLRMVELLLKYNPDFDHDIVREKFYQCLLSASSEDGKIVTLMLDHGFTVKSTDNLTTTVLWSSVLLGLKELAISIVNLGEDNLKSAVKMWYKSFLVHWRPFSKLQNTMYEIVENINELFLKERETNILDCHNLSLFKILLSEFDIELINVCIMSTGGNFDNLSDLVAITKDVLVSCYNSENPICDSEGRTGLHYAAKVGNAAVIHALLDLNLDINAVDIYGKTPLDYAYEQINNYSNFENNDETVNNESHYDLEFKCWFTLLDLKIGAIVLLKHMSKLMTANFYINLKNLKTVNSLLIIMSKDNIITQYYLSIFAIIEKCEKEINLLKSKKLKELSYCDILSKNIDQIALYTKRREVIDVFQLDDTIREFEIYGPMLQHRFHTGCIRRGLTERAENILFNILKWKNIPLAVVREILSNLNNEELFYIVTKQNDT